MSYLKFFSIFFCLFLISCNSNNAQVNVLNVPAETITQPVLVDSSDSLGFYIASGWKLLDVRTPEEFSQSCLDGALNVDFNSPDFLEEISTLDKEASYLVYCRSGNRSSKAITQMQELGFKNLKNLDGGVLKLQSENFAFSYNCK